MILCFDIGNTDIDVGVFEKDTLSKSFRIEYVKGQQSWAYVEPIQKGLRENGISISDVEDCILCSVVHNTTQGFFVALNEVFGYNPKMFTNDRIVDMKVKIRNPQEVGTDIVASCLVVRDKYTFPAIVIDMGTATTITAMDSEGAILGVSILTGVITSLNALHDRTGLPVDPGLPIPEKAIGTDTPKSIASGAVFGRAAMMDGMIDRFKEEMGTDAAIYATGGVSKVIFPLCRNKAIINNDLLLEGMYCYYLRSKCDIKDRKEYK